jgi:hypothetical protein
MNEHDSKKPKDQPVKTENSEDLNRKCWILQDKELHLNRGEIDVKGPHAEWRTLKTREASPMKAATKWAKMVQGWSAQVGRPDPFLGPFVPPFDLNAS